MFETSEFALHPINVFLKTVKWLKLPTFSFIAFKHVTITSLWLDTFFFYVELQKKIIAKINNYFKTSTSPYFHLLHGWFRNGPATLTIRFSYNQFTNIFTIVWTSKIWWWIHAPRATKVNNQMIEVHFQCLI